MKELEKENLDNALFKLEGQLDEAYRISKIKNISIVYSNTNKMEEAKQHFDTVKKYINGEIIGDKDVLLEYINGEIIGDKDVLLEYINGEIIGDKDVLLEYINGEIIGDKDVLLEYINGEIIGDKDVLLEYINGEIIGDKDVLLEYINGEIIGDKDVLLEYMNGEIIGDKDVLLEYINGEIIGDKDVLLEYMNGEIIGDKDVLLEYINGEIIGDKDVLLEYINGEIIGDKDVLLEYINGEIIGDKDVLLEYINGEIIGDKDVLLEYINGEIIGDKDVLLEYMNGEIIGDKDVLLEYINGEIIGDKDVLLEYINGEIIGDKDVLLEYINGEIIGDKDVLLEYINGEIIGDKDVLLERYFSTRNSIPKESFIKEQTSWSELTAEHNSKRLWEKIDWKGNINKQNTRSPIFEDLVNYFEKLYETSKDLEKMKILMSDVTKPILDDPLSKNELDVAIGNMKKGGYDHTVGIFKTIVNFMSPLILLLLNIMFFICYPARLSVALLNAIPKKGNLSLPTNFRGIQLLPAMAVLYDRVISYRLLLWIGVDNEQSAFQKVDRLDIKYSQSVYLLKLLKCVEQPCILVCLT